MTAREIALGLLTEYHCDLDCYRDDMENAVKDIQTLIDDGREFEVDVNEIAIALVEIGNEQPIIIPPRMEYCMIFDTDNVTDGIEFESLEAAKCDAFDIYILWEGEEMWNWEMVDGIPRPTEEQIENWDYMIDNCYCHVAKWVPEEDSYSETVWEPSDKELSDIGWDYWANLKERYGW